MKRLLLTSLFTAAAIQARGLDELFDQMFDLQREIQQTFFEQAFQPMVVHSSSPLDINFKEDAGLLTMTIKGVELSAEKPDFSFDTDQRDHGIELDITFDNGAVTIHGQGDVIAMNSEYQKNEAVNGRKQSSHQVFQQQFRLKAPVSLDIPKITYDKQEKTMTIGLVLEQLPQKKAKQQYPIDLK